MTAVAVLCLIVGFALVTPRRAVPGASSAARMIRLAPGWLQRPNDEESSAKRRWLMVVVGLVLMGVGVAILWNTQA